MKIPTTQLFAAAAVSLGMAIAVQAGGTGGRGAGRGLGASSRPASTQRTAEDAAEITALKPAFTTLLGADHDYDGHRIKAMMAIAEACRMMGTDIVPPDLREKLERAGGGRGATTGPATQGSPVKHASTEPESQSASDAQLKQAQTTVQQVRDGIGAGKQPRIAAKLDDAINEINVALTKK